MQRDNNEFGEIEKSAAGRQEGWKDTPAAPGGVSPAAPATTVRPRGRPGTRQQYNSVLDFVFLPGVVYVNANRPYRRMDLDPLTIPFMRKLTGAAVFDAPAVVVCNDHGRLVATFRDNPNKYCAKCGMVLDG